MLLGKTVEEAEKIKKTLKISFSSVVGGLSFSQSRKIFSRLSILKKISYGYCLAIGIGVSGTIVGLMIGDSSQQKALSQLTIAYQQQNIVTQLENALKSLQSHPQQLIIVLGDNISYDYEVVKFYDNLNRIQHQIYKLDTFTELHAEDIVVEQKDVQKLFQAYNTTIKSYVELMESLWKEIKPATLVQEEIPTAQQQIWNTLRDQEATQISLEFERISEQLTRLITKAELQQKQADIQLQKANNLRVMIIVTSLFLSTTIAIILAILTSRAIALPIQKVTKVAQRVTEESNFSLRVPVRSTDEIGTLAVSLNQLIEWVEKYTQDLRQAIKDLKTAQAQLIQSEKMSSLGQMVAGIAHEINNPISFIHGNITPALEQIQDLLNLVDLYQQNCSQISPEVEAKIAEIDLEFIAEDLPKLLSSMKMGTQRIREIVLSLRNFSRLDEAEIKQADIHEGIDSTLLLLNHRLKPEIEVVKQYGNIPLIDCYPAQLNQVFMNIISNAIDALEEAKTHILYGVEFSVPSQITIQTEPINTQQIQVRIRDNGLGIRPEIKHKLFDPFFTTKKIGKGTGIGLSICYQIIQNHQGKIEVVSEYKKGAEFIITLPIISKKCRK
ncbi:sensor histidine kinase [Limnoraphis robusta]|uniref:histidine kinase n=1 Tax=Limnoraphis robusta CCNP1315 TaxID=3110306 RepID=A0ABU5U1A6_9CYAN|nr:ATP-binding protein [Limnoraphis robusta]MEA5520967.1 ATP-binding protein [Limnoraphis robusta CCNP1315]MEA5543640.1 ATP-binding protein [Limnoraphis robusta CCNP1324]